MNLSAIVVGVIVGDDFTSSSHNNFDKYKRLEKSTLMLNQQFSRMNSRHEKKKKKTHPVSKGLGAVWFAQQHEFDKKAHSNSDSIE